MSQISDCSTIYSCILLPTKKEEKEKEKEKSSLIVLLHLLRVSWQSYTIII